MTAAQIIGVDHAAGRDIGVATIRNRAGDIVATLYQGDAYEIRPKLGWMDADVMDPPFLIDETMNCAIDAAVAMSQPKPDRDKVRAHLELTAAMAIAALGKLKASAK